MRSFRAIAIRISQPNVTNELQLKLRAIWPRMNMPPLLWSLFLSPISDGGGGGGGGGGG